MTDLIKHHIPRERALHGMGVLLATLRAAYQIHQNAHWQASGPAYYGDHLLYQRLYETVAEEIDQVGEKLVGVYGAHIDPLRQSEMVASFVAEIKGADFVMRSLRAEKTLVSFLSVLHSDLDERGLLSLGMDDFLGSLASSHEDHVYLLSQRSAKALEIS